MATSSTSASKTTPTAPSAASTAFKNGDHVQVRARDQSAADIKSGLYYKHYANLHGTILKLYGEEASVLVDRESLSAEVRERHESGEKAMRKKWLDGLSEEGRNRLSTREKEFGLNYAILVAVGDLKPFDPSQIPAAPETTSPDSSANAKEIARAAAAINPATGESDVDVAKVNPTEGLSGTDSNVKRLSESQLAEAEDKFLAERARVTKKNGSA
ncbi:MAG: hypothetical protein V4671_27370 [Armatimonadota bacterium]